MNYQKITKDELIKELRKLQQEYESLKTSYEKDITERKKVEEALKFTRLILDNAADTMACIASDGHYIEVNDAFCRSVGYSRKELLSMTVHDIDPLFPAATWPEFWEKLKQAGSLTFESVHRTKEGKLIPVEINVNFFEYEGKEYHCGFARDITERKQAEEALRQSEKKLNTLFEILPIGVSILDAERNIVLVNPALERILNITKDDLIRGDYKSWKYIRSDGTQMPEGEFASVRAIREQRVVHDVETGVLMEDGHVIWTNVNAAPVPFPDWKVVIITTNITERKQTEAALHLEKENFRHSLDDSPLGVRIATIEGNTIYANKTLLDIYGYENLEELQKTPLKDRYTPESYIQAQKRKLQRKRGDFTATEYEISIVRKDGGICHLQVFRKEILWDGVRQFQVICNDITERKQAEEALRESEERFMNLSSISREGIMIHEGGVILEANKAFAKLVNYDGPEDLIGKNGMEVLLFTPESSQIIQKHIRSDSTESYDINLIRGDGRIIPCETSGCNIILRGRKVRLVYMRDITERKQAEEEIIKSKELLEDLHTHLNEILENERAQISREIHDELGQSLTALKLDLNRLYKYVNANHEAVTQLDSMIELISDTIKDVQRIASDLRPGILDELGLVSAIEWYCGEFENRTRIKCTLELDNSDYSNPQINLTFFRALQETLTNVIRHARASSVKVILQQTNQGTTLTIQDDGIGISREEIDSNKSLGLISMHERVKQFNGKIEISSKKEDGTKLTVFIPS